MSLFVLFLFFVCGATNFILGEWVIQNSTSHTLDYVSVPGLKGFYKFYAPSGSWNEARAICDNEDADLYYPQSKIELGRMMKHWKSKNDTVPSAFIVGIERHEDHFRTIHDEPISSVFNSWRLGEPNNDNGDEDCVSIHHVRLQWKLNDIPCYTKLDMPFICKSPIDPKYEAYEVVTEDSTAVTDMPSTEVNNTKLNDYISYSTVPGLNDTYKLYKTASTWEVAQSTCDADGAILYYPKNESELNTLKNFWEAKEEYFPIELHVGIDNSGSGYKTIDDLPISSAYNVWRSNGTKSVRGDITCVAIYNETNSWVLDDVKCNAGARHPFMCRSPLSADMKCKSSTYMYSEQLGKCYKLHVTPKTWSEAQKVCRADLSELAVINSREEAEYLVRLTSIIHRSRIPGTFTHGVVLLGFHTNSVEDWQTIDGTSLYDSGYACWGNNQPDNEEHHKCGSMFYNGHLNDIGCDEKAFFICEHNTPNYAYEPPTAENSLQCFDDVKMSKKFMKHPL